MNIRFYIDSLCGKAAGESHIVLSVIFRYISAGAWCHATTSHFIL